MNEMRLQKYLARAGIASRRAAEKLIEEGRVAVNGSVVCELGTKVDADADIITFDGEPVQLEDAHTTIMLNKPCGYITTMNDEQGRASVADLIPLDEHPALFPIGRLDKDSCGLLLFTDDGELGNRLVHPRHHVGKSYIAEVQGTPTPAEIERFRGGIELDGALTQPAECELLESGRTSKLFVRIYEGRNRQIRRMFEVLGHAVTRLERVRIGNLDLGDLEAGTWRYLTDEDLALLV